MHTQHTPSRVAALPRRGFLATGVATAAGVAATSAPAQEPTLAEPLLTPGATVLFQGDSITDSHRDRAVGEPNRHEGWGNGYAFLAATELLISYPELALKVYNRGISGNKVPDLDARWQQDCLDLKPNVLSILIGVNDLWHRFTHGYQGTADSYYNGYRALIEETRRQLPEVKLVIGEPFLLKGGAVGDEFFPVINDYRDAAEAIAIEFADAWVPYQAVFDAATRVAPASAWLPDGVHPSPAGSALMAHAWANAVAGCSAVGSIDELVAPNVEQIATPAEYQQPQPEPAAAQPQPATSNKPADGNQPATDETADNGEDPDRRRGRRIDRIRGRIRRALR